MRTAAAALVTLVLAAGCGSADEAVSPQQTTTVAEAPNGAARPDAPQLSGESLAGMTIRLGDFRGRPVLINVWSSW